MRCGGARPVDCGHVPQPADGVTYAHKLDKREGWLDFALDADVLARRVRAFDPFPVACARRGETTLKIWRARALRSRQPRRPGTVLEASAAGLHVACGSGTLAVTELQRPGSRRMSAGEFLAGLPIGVGEVLTGPPAESPARMIGNAPPLADALQRGRIGVARPAQRQFARPRAGRRRRNVRRGNAASSATGRRGEGHRLWRDPASGADRGDAGRGSFTARPIRRSRRCLR
jgi:hypothetical protein